MERFALYGIVKNYFLSIIKKNVPLNKCHICITLMKNKDNYSIKQFLKGNGISFLSLIEATLKIDAPIKNIMASKVKSTSKMFLDIEKIQLSSNKRGLVLIFPGKTSTKKIRISIDDSRASLLFRAENEVGPAILLKESVSCRMLWVDSYINDLKDFFQKLKQEKGLFKAVLEILRESIIIWYWIKEIFELFF